MERDNGAPAFPVTAGQTVYSHGMALRDWFAGQILAGAVDASIDQRVGESVESALSRYWTQAAVAAYIAADAMLAARKGGDA